jgi:hypothetical protein
VNPAPDYPRLRGWLGLPPGPWPPDHYTLLGLPPGEADATAVESRVLDRMDRLRTHQLVHPDLVTEGMNRLAQALVCLTDPAMKAAHDAEHGITPAPPPPPPYEVVEPYEVVAPAEVDFRPGMRPPDDATESGPVGVPGDVTQVIEVPRPPEVAALYEVIADLPPAEPPPKPPPKPPELPAVPADPAARRWVYRRLAAVRRGLRAWAKLRPVLTDPRDPLDRPGQALLLVEAAAAVRAALPDLRGVVGRPGEAGGLVAAVVGSPFVLDTIRHLLLDQRQAVALDWRRGELELQREYRRLRDLARVSRPRRPAGRDPRAVLRLVRDTPELVLLALALLALVAAALRGGR